MTAFLKIPKKNVRFTTYISKKSWSLNQEQRDLAQIQVLKGVTGSNTYFLDDSDVLSGSLEYSHLVYRSIKHLYYRGDLERYETYPQTTLTYPSESIRRLGDEIQVISIPRAIVGNGIEPGTVVMTPSSTDLDYLIREPDYIDESSEEYVDIVGTNTYILADDGEGNLYKLGGAKPSVSSSIDLVGNIIYSKGLILITDSNLVDYYSDNSNFTASWNSTYPIYTYDITLNIPSNLLNMTQNPSITTGSFGKIKPFATASEFQPYITTVGLYNDAHELLAVAKLSKPLIKSHNIDMSINLKLEI
jgi:hypothetical protein